MLDEKKKDIAQYWQHEKKSKLTLWLEILHACFYYMLIILDNRQHMTGWGPWLFGNNPSQWGSSVPSVQQTHLQSCSICSSSLWQLLSLSFVVTLRCRDATTQKLWQLGCSDNLLTFFSPPISSYHGPCETSISSHWLEDGNARAGSA